jgi:hypothetical protein
MSLSCELLGTNPKIQRSIPAKSADEESLDFKPFNELVT